MKLKKSPWSWVPTLYFAEGLPYVAVMTISIILYKQLGLSNAEITFYTSWLYLPWVIKPLWSPFIDLVKTKRWWIVSMSLLMGAAFGGVAFTIPTDFWLQGTLFFFWLMAFSSATHDIAADGFYMLAHSPSSQAAFIGIRSVFYRVASVFGQGVLVAIAGLIESNGFSPLGVEAGNIPASWQITLGVAAVVFGLITLYHTFALPHSDQDKPRVSAEGGNTMSNNLVELVNSFKTFFMKPGCLLAIAFMLLYRLPEGFLIKLCQPFLVHSLEEGGLGLSTELVGTVYGVFGVIALLLGGILGGVYSSRVGLKKSLWVMAGFMTLPCLTFVYLAMAQPSNVVIITIALCIEKFGYGFGFTAYMLYMMYFSEGEYKTSHYAVCTAFMALSMMLPGFVAGYIQEAIGYVWFFWMVMICCFATLIVTYFADRKIDPNYGKKEDENK